MNILPPGFNKVLEELPESAWLLPADNTPVEPVDPISTNVLPMVPSPYGDLAQTLIRRRKSGQPPAA